MAWEERYWFLWTYQMSNFILIDKNILVNVDRIDAIELAKYNRKPIFYAYVNGKKFVITSDIREVLKSVETKDIPFESWVG